MSKNKYKNHYNYFTIFIEKGRVEAKKKNLLKLCLPRPLPTLSYTRASQRGPGGPTEVHSATTWDPQKNAVLHLHNEGINNKCILSVTS